jgi:hypothetical protein
VVGGAILVARVKKLSGSAPTSSKGEEGGGAAGAGHTWRARILELHADSLVVHEGAAGARRRLLLSVVNEISEIESAGAARNVLGIHAVGGTLYVQFETTAERAQFAAATRRAVAMMAQRA